MDEFTTNTHSEREHPKANYKGLYDELLVILFRHDPIGINFEANADEYAPEVGTILPRLHAAQSATDVRHIVHEEFVRWFDSDTAGPEAGYEALADDIWTAWQRYKKASR